jgi:hypothetical protein
MSEGPVGGSPPAVVNTTPSLIWAKRSSMEIGGFHVIHPVQVLVQFCLRDATVGVV